MSRLGSVTIVVDDDDRAIRHFVDDLGLSIFLHTDGFDADHASLALRGIEFEEAPRRGLD